MGRTLFDKIWDDHLVVQEPGTPALVYVDLHLVHEVTSPQAFEGLRLAGRSVRRPGATIATIDHNVPTTDRSLPILDEIARKQMETLRRNVGDFGITLYDVDSPSQGIVHVIGPELGYTQPGSIIVCGDSHTSTHGALGALAAGIGTSEVEHVLATQCLRWVKPKSMELRVDGETDTGVTPKDVILHVIGSIGVGGASGHVVEYRGAVFEEMSVEGRMTVCNMSIEAGARAGMIAPDTRTFEYLRGKPFAPCADGFEAAEERWNTYRTDSDAQFDRSVSFDGPSIKPMVTWGTQPAMSSSIDGEIPDPAAMADADQRRAAERALEYMGLEPGMQLDSLDVDCVFIGSCTNSRIEDLRAAAEIAAGRRVASSVRAMVVPGSTAVKHQAEAEGLARIFVDAGFEWREAGCSMCLAMNPDRLQPFERCASTSNRNFEGRQGPKGRTHLMSPVNAAAAAVAGHVADAREFRNPSEREGR